jgi:hypothetical protein
MTEDTTRPRSARAPPAANDMADRSKEGEATFVKNHSIVVCTIDSQSDGGAHLRMTDTRGVPQEFYLAQSSRAFSTGWKSAWRTATGVGLRILGPLYQAKHGGRDGYWVHQSDPSSTTEAAPTWVSPPVLVGPQQCDPT